jgi:hypothetical protein
MTAEIGAEAILESPNILMPSRQSLDEGKHVERSNEQAMDATAKGGIFRMDISD